MQNRVGGGGASKLVGRGRAALAKAGRQIVPRVLQGRKEKANLQQEQDFSCTQSQDKECPKFINYPAGHPPVQSRPVRRITNS